MSKESGRATAKTLVRSAQCIIPENATREDARSVTGTLIHNHNHVELKRGRVLDDRPRLAGRVVKECLVAHPHAKYQGLHLSLLSAGSRQPEYL